jgi:hypothetical protein
MPMLWPGFALPQKKRRLKKNSSIAVDIGMTRVCGFQEVTNRNFCHLSSFSVNNKNGGLSLLIAIQCHIKEFHFLFIHQSMDSPYNLLNPEYKKYSHPTLPILATHGLGNLLSAFNLGLTMNAWGIDITDTLF